MNLIRLRKSTLLLSNGGPCAKTFLKSIGVHCLNQEDSVHPNKPPLVSGTFIFLS
jgi:hypothetical protein